MSENEERPADDLTVAIAELASIQVDMLRMMERRDRELFYRPQSENKLYAAGISEASSYRAELQRLLGRSQIVLKWMAQRIGAL